MKRALLIIDVQVGFFQVAVPPADAAEVIAQINALALRARNAGDMVIFIQFEEPGVSYGSPEWQLDPRLEVYAIDLKLRKTTPDAFLNTTLEATLLGSEVNALVVCGYASEFCIDSTTRRAAALGFNVTIAGDAHTTDDQPHLSARQITAHHNFSLPLMTSFPGRIECRTAAELWA